MAARCARQVGWIEELDVQESWWDFLRYEKVLSQERNVVGIKGRASACQCLSSRLHDVSMSFSQSRVMTGEYHYPQTNIIFVFAKSIHPTAKSWDIEESHNRETVYSAVGQDGRAVRFFF
jgi:hypothetical protein